MDANASLRAAVAALKLWPSRSPDACLVPFGTSASSVFGVRVNGATHFLRLTEEPDRSAVLMTPPTSSRFCIIYVHTACALRRRLPSIHGEIVERVGDCSCNVPVSAAPPACG